MDRTRKEKKIMKCVICHGINIEVIKVKEEIIIGNNIVYIPIKVPVCKNCGERYYNRSTIQFLEDAEEKLHKKKAKLKEIGKVLMSS